MIASIPQSEPLRLSGERFRVLYRVAGSESEALTRAKDICLEQTVEFPADLVPDGPIRDGMVGRLELFEEVGPQHFLATISFPVEAAGDDVSQLLNVVFGNISLKPGLRAEKLGLRRASRRSSAGRGSAAPVSARRPASAIAPCFRPP